MEVWNLDEQATAGDVLEMLAAAMADILIMQRSIKKLRPLIILTFFHLKFVITSQQSRDDVCFIFITDALKGI